jgi:hypothetical protein
MKALLVCLVLLSATVQAEPNAASLNQSHGTVNILLANRNGLVLVTDSMLTSTDGQHQPNGTKLFKVDEKTICAMAGQYSIPGVLTEFEAAFPNIMAQYIRAERIRATSFYTKLEILIHTFQFALSSNLNSLASLDSADVPVVLSKLQDIELTLAGYDDDGTLKVAQVALKAVQTGDGFSLVPYELPFSKYALGCELTAKPDDLKYYDHSLPKPKIVGNALYCAVAGLRDAPEQRLANFKQFPTLPALQVYAERQSKHTDLSVEEMRSLALELERESEADEAKNHTWRVGGDPKVAILRDGRVSDSPPVQPVDDRRGSALLVARRDDVVADCSALPGGEGMIFDSSRSLAQVQATVRNCNQRLDGILFHDSEFIGSALSYFGYGPLLFPASNKVEDSTLQLAPTADINKPDIRDLVCNFHWKTVTRGESVLTLPCH